MTTETKPELTQADEYRREVSGELSIAMKELHSAQAEWEQLMDETKEAKSSVDVAQRRVNRLADELRDIEVGQYQPRLMKPMTNGQATSPVGPSPEPAAEPTPIEVLADHGLTAKQVEMLRSSELEISTVEDLERCMREDEWWHKKVKGLGQKKIDLVSDALLAFRKANPVPIDETGEAGDKTGEGHPVPADRNAPGGVVCGNVNRGRLNAKWGSVTIATGLMPDQTWRSSWMLQREGQQTVGRETPRQDSEPSLTQAEAAHCAVAELNDMLNGEAKREVLEWASSHWQLIPTDAELTE